MSLAAHYGNEDVVILLIRKSAKLIRDNYGMNAIQYAARSGFENVVDILIDRFPLRINDEDKERKTAVYLAAYQWYPKVIKVLLKKRCSFQQTRYVGSHERI